MTWDAQRREKGGYEHFMRKEIHEQPATIRDTMRGRITAEDAVELPELGLTAEKIKQFERIYLVACGTAYHAGLVAKQFMEKRLRIPVETDLASEFRYRDPVITDKTLVIVISQSGETADTIAAMRMAAAKGATTLGIVNVIGSTISREAEHVLHTQAGPEICVASTKAYVSQLIAVYLLGLYLARAARRALGGRGAGGRRRACARSRSRCRKCWTASRRSRAGGEVRRLQRLLLPGTRAGLRRGAGRGAEAEGDQLHPLRGAGRGGDEARHAGADHPGCRDHLHRHPAGALREDDEQHQRGQGAEATVLGIVRASDTHSRHSMDDLIHVPETLDELMPVPTIVPMQLLAYHIARLNGCEIDQPRNLAKSVTVE